MYLPLLISGHSERGQARAGVPVLGMLGLLTHCSFCIFKNIYLFIVCIWLHWVLVAACEIFSCSL